MDGKSSRTNPSDRPIAKPVFPLPGIFSLRMRSELPTQPQWTGEKLERAHFFRKGKSSSGSPVYGFYITREDVGREVRRD